MPLIFATRPSTLARWQTGWVIRALRRARPGLVCEERLVTTQGDQRLDRPLPEIGGKGLFTQELEAELLSRRVQAAVHSLKDLPIQLGEGLVIGAVPVRAEVRDALISAQGYSLETLPQGARVGTSSLRRAAQLLACRPDLAIESLRGNVDTRLHKAREGRYDAIVLAGAGLARLGLLEHVSQWLPLEVMLPAPGQGALAVQCRADDSDTLEILNAVEDDHTRAAITAERAFLAGLGGGCAVPVAAHAETGGPEISLTGLVAAVDGSRLIRVQGRGPDPFSLGSELARQAIAQGAAQLLNMPPARLSQAGDS